MRQEGSKDSMLSCEPRHNCKRLHWITPVFREGTPLQEVLGLAGGYQGGRRRGVQVMKQRAWEAGDGGQLQRGNVVRPFRGHVQPAPPDHVVPWPAPTAVDVLDGDQLA